MTDKEYKEYHTFLNTTLFDVKEIFVSEKRWKQVHDLLYEYMKMGFEEERVRKHPLKYSFDGGKTVYEMECRHFIVNMIMWYPMLRFDAVDDLSVDFVVDCSCLSSGQIMGHFNEKMIEPYRDSVDPTEMNLIFADTIYKLSLISLDFNEIMGISIDIDMFIDLAEKSPEFDECIHTKPSPGMQPVDIEKLCHERMNKIISIMKDLDNDIKPILNSGEGIKDKQLSEFTVMGGLKPDIIGNTIPVPIDTNFIVGGLNSVSNYYIDKQAGRKAVVANKTLMGNAGYFAAKIMKVTKDTRLDSSVHDCHSQHPIFYHVLDKKHLKIIDKSYYALTKGGELRVVNAKKDSFLIGKDIYLRTPATCGLEGNRVCEVCYGEMSKVNNNPQFGAGGYASAITANKYQQDTLSTKHLLTTNSVPIKFPPEFYKIFTLEYSIIGIKLDKIDNPARWTIIINEERLVEYDKLEFNSHTTQFIIRDNETGEEHIIEEEDGKEIFIYQDVIDNFSHKKGRIELDIGKLDDDIMLGIIVVENNELTKPLKNMQALLDSKYHFECVTVDDMINRMADLMIGAKMGALLVHGSMTIKNLIRCKDDIFKTPRFSSYYEGEYTILTITDALINNPSLTTGLASQNLRDQFTNPATYRKHAKASTDVYFMKSLVKK